MEDPDIGSERYDEEKVDNSEFEDCSTSSSISEILKDLPDVLTFIQRLQDCILRQRTLIHRLYGRLKEESFIKGTKQDACTQTDEMFDAADAESLVEDIKKAAESVVQQTGFVYEETSGMYYDYNTGYYYNAELGLYYDGQNGIYYYFDKDSKSFQFHSQVSLEQAVVNDSDFVVNINEDDKKRKQADDSNTDKIPKKIKQESREEGECTESDTESDNETEIKHIEKCDIVNSIQVEESKIKPNVIEIVSSDNEIANAWPPCLRIVVKETSLENLVVGSLFIVTCTGGTLGREGDHAVIIPDINISKHHAKVSFDEAAGHYNIVDLGSRNGTFIDGKRLSVALRESDPAVLHHGTVVRVGTTHLECHLHCGRETCEDCEPGCAQRKAVGLANTIEVVEKDHQTKETRHRSELRRLRKRFGLDKLKPKESVPSLAPGYQDRAEERRKTKGSSDHHAKTETASVHESIKSQNKGFKMLSKMGWAEGQSLGKDSTKGITEPITVEQRPQKAGLGSDVVVLPTPDPKTKRKTEIWKKAQQRFQDLVNDEDDD